MKPSRARRLSEQWGVEQLIIKHPEISNPFQEDDRRFKMFEYNKAQYNHMEDLLDILGGRPEQQNKEGE